MGKFLWEHLVGEWLAKALEPAEHEFIQNVFPSRLDVDHKSHLGIHPFHNKEIVDDFNNNLRDTQPVIPESIGGVSGYFPKVIFDSPVTGRRFLLKPYHDVDPSANYMPPQGWNEMLTQQLYHASGIGHLHHHVHVDHHMVGKNLETHPVTVVSFHDTIKHRVHQYPDYNKLSNEEWEKLGADASKIAFMDFLTNNVDRHAGNLLVGRGKGGEIQPLAIDHGYAFHPDGHEAPFGYRLEGSSGFNSLERAFWKYRPGGTVYDRTAIASAAKWFMENAGTFNDVFNKNISMFKNPHLAKFLGERYTNRHAALLGWSKRIASGVDPFSDIYSVQGT